jgi:hypothetical protein
MPVVMQKKVFLLQFHLAFLLDGLVSSCQHDVVAVWVHDSRGFDAAFVKWMVHVTFTRKMSEPIGVAVTSTKTESPNRRS